MNVSEATASKPGRPTEYDPEFCLQAAELCANGATDDELADFFGVATRTIYRWRNKYPEFSQALIVGKEHADSRVERSLYSRATGQRWVEQQAFKIKDVQYADGRPVKATERIEIVEVERSAPPDTTAIQFWLTNRKKADWRNKQELEHTGKDGGAIKTEDVTSPTDMARRVAFLLASAVADKKD